MGLEETGRRWEERLHGGQEGERNGRSGSQERAAVRKGREGSGEAAGDRSRRSGQKGQLVPEEEGRLESID